MAGFKKHLPVFQHNDRRRGRHHGCLHALGFRRHGDLFLHEVDKQVKDHAGQDGAVAGQVYPGNEVAQRNTADKEIDHIQRVHRQPRLIRPPDKEQREMPEGPEDAEEKGFPEPVHTVPDRILAVAFPADLLYDRSQQDRGQRASDAHAGKGEVLREGELVRALPEHQRKQDGGGRDQRENAHRQEDIGPFYLVKPDQLPPEVSLQFFRPGQQDKQGGHSRRSEQPQHHQRRGGLLRHKGGRNPEDPGKQVGQDKKQHRPVSVADGSGLRCHHGFLRFILFMILCVLTDRLPVGYMV